MARLARLTLAGHVHHVIQRGINGQIIFHDDDDRKLFLQLIYEAARYGRVAVHAYVLLDNQIQFLITPASDIALPRFMQTIGRRYVRYFNDRYSRSGTLWDGRYRSAIIEADDYLLPCMAMMDNLPVVEGKSDAPEHFNWSSHAHFIGRNVDRCITPHPCIWAIGNTPFAREAAYARLVKESDGASTRSEFLESTQGGWALGTEKFKLDLEKSVSRRVRKGKPGRPRKTSNAAMVN